MDRLITLVVLTHLTAAGDLWPSHLTSGSSLLRFVWSPTAVTLWLRRKKKSASYVWKLWLYWLWGVDAVSFHWRQQEGQLPNLDWCQSMQSRCVVAYCVYRALNWSLTGSPPTCLSAGDRDTQVSFGRWATKFPSLSHPGPLRHLDVLAWFDRIEYNSIIKEFNVARLRAAMEVKPTSWYFKNHNPNFEPQRLRLKVK